MQYFLKCVPLAKAAAEVSGWEAVRSLLPVPSLVGHHQVGRDRAVVAYEDVFASGRCAHLLGDVIGLADHGLCSTSVVATLITDICADLLEAASKTACRARLDSCVPALYLERLSAGGRLDTWYRRDRCIAIGARKISVGDLAQTELITDSARCRVDLAGLISKTRRSLAPGSRWMTAVTQGDPTEPNIAYPLVWLDFEHAGRNVLAGDVANLLWYLLAMGGWLVPAYQHDVYLRTLRYHLGPVATPVVDHLDVSERHRRIEIESRWRVGAGRGAALDALLAALHGDLGALCAIGLPNVITAIRPFLVCRILGVVNLGSLSGCDAALCLARLAQLYRADLTVDELLTYVPATPPAKLAELTDWIPAIRAPRSCKSEGVKLS